MNMQVSIGCSGNLKNALLSCCSIYYIYSRWRHRPHCDGTTVGTVPLAAASSLDEVHVTFM